MHIVQLIELHYGTDDADFDNRPEHIEIELTPELVSKIACARAALATGLFGTRPEMRLYLDQPFRLLNEDLEEYEANKDGEFGGDFEVSSEWLTVEAERIGVILWEENSGHELSGFCENAEAHELLQAIEQVMPKARADLSAQLAQAAETITERINAAKLVDMTADPAAIDDDTGAPVMRPVHLIVGDTAYWLEPAFPPLPGCNGDVLMGAPLADGGAVCWDDEREIAEADCADFDAIRERLEPYTPAKRV